MHSQTAAVRQHDVLARDDEPLAARAAGPQRVAPVGAARRPREGLHGRLHEVLLDEARREAAGERREVAFLFLWCLVRRVGVDVRPEAGAHGFVSRRPLAEEDSPKAVLTSWLVYARYVGAPRQRKEAIPNE